MILCIDILEHRSLDARRGTSGRAYDRDGGSIGRLAEVPTASLSLVVLIGTGYELQQ